MLAVSSSSSLTPNTRRPILRRHFSPSSSSTSDELYRPRTITIEKPTNSSSYGFSIQTYGFASLNPLTNDESACSLVSSSSESTASRKSSGSASFCSTSANAPIQLLTYVDYVQDKSVAWEAGLRAGSVILAVNDQGVEQDDHGALVKRITETATAQLKLMIVQQNVNKQIVLCEQLQQLHKQLHEKEAEFEDLCRQEKNIHGDAPIRGNESGHRDIFISSRRSIVVVDTPSPSPRLQRAHSSERTPSFCHDKIPLDWRQSVTNFAHQQKLITTRTLPTIVNSTSSIASSKYTRARPSNPTHQHQRSMSLSSIALHYSRSSLCRQHSSLLKPQSIHQRRALSFEELVSKADLLKASRLSFNRPDDSVLASGCSLAMDLSRSFDLKKNQSSSSSTINTDDEQPNSKSDHRIRQLKWKLRINE